MQKLCRIINWTFHKFCNWNWQGSSHRTGSSSFSPCPLQSAFIAPAWHCQRLWQLWQFSLSLSLSRFRHNNKAAAQNLWLAAFRLCFAAYYCYWHQQWHIRSAYSTPVGAHLLPWYREQFPSLSLAPLPRYRDSMASNVAYAGLLILEKGNIFSTAADRLLFSIIVLAWTGLVWPVPCLGFGLDSVPFCRKLLLTTEAAVRHKLGVEFAACFTFFSSALLLPLTSPASFGFHFFHFYSPL